MIGQSKINEWLPDMTQSNMSVDVSVSVLQYKMVGLGLWCLTPLSTIFQLYRGGQFYWWMKPEKSTDMSQVIDKLYHIMLYRVHPHLSGIRTRNVCGDRH